MNNRVTHLLRAITMGSAAFLAQSALSQVVGYNNTTTYSGDFFNYADPTPNPGNYNGEAGNEIGLTGSLSSYTITAFDVQFDFLNSSLTTTGTPAGGETVDLTFYQNNGSIVDGYPSPSTVLYTTGAVPFSTAGINGFTTGQSLNDTGLSVTVPQDFTWTVTFGGLTAGETAGLAVYGPATVGDNSGDSWVNTTGGWTLEVNAPGEPFPLEYGAEAFVTAVPEPSTVALGVAGAFALLAARRKK